MHRRSGSGGMNRSGGRYDMGTGGYGQMSGRFERDFMDEMAYRREMMMQRGMMGDMQFYGGMMGNMGMGMPMGMMERSMMMGMDMRGANRGQNRGGGGGDDRRDRNFKGNAPRGNQSGPGRRDGGRPDRSPRGAPAGGRGGMQRNRSDPGQGAHQRRLGDMRNERDQNRRRDREQNQWDRRGGPHDLQIKESGPLGKIKAIARRIKEWGNFGYGLPFWNRRANIYRRLANFLERGNLDHTIVFIGHGSDCVCRLYIDGLYLAEGSGASKSEARSDAYYRAVERMRVRNFNQLITVDDKFNTESLRGFEVDQVISESPGNHLTFESNYAHVATNRIADFNYPWDKLVLVERTGMSNAGLKLRLSANLNGLLLEQNTSKAVPPGETKPQWKFAITLEQKLLSEGYHDRQGIARSNACIEAMNKLELICYTVKIERYRFPKINISRDDRRGGRRQQDSRSKDGKKDEKKGTETEGKAETAKEEEKEEAETEKAEEEEAEEKQEEAEGDQTKEDHLEAEEQDDQDLEEVDQNKPFVPPAADLRRSDLVDAEQTGKEEEEEEKAEATEEAKDESMEEGDDAKKDDEEEGEKKEKDAEEKKEEVSQLQKRLKDKMETEAKQRKKAEFLFKIRKAIEEKMTEFAGTRSFGQLILEGFWLEERDHVVRLCRKLKLRSYVDKYRNSDGKVVHYIFVSQIIPMEELVTALKAAPENKLGSYSLHPPKTAEEVEEAKKKREEMIKASREKYQGKTSKDKEDKKEKEKEKKEEKK